ncbi:hypothetical protein EON63_18240 [archaeon]|nr:MAG: hypothetical protein EON63_18240 [archaeon]
MVHIDIDIDTPHILNHPPSILHPTSYTIHHIPYNIHIPICPGLSDGILLLAQSVCPAQSLSPLLHDASADACVVDHAPPGVWSMVYGA